MSSINTGAIDVNYPVAGVNNNSQGFRDNFNAIKSNLDTASAEITDLQNKAVVKSALNDTTLNNDMNNTLISNALIQGFRHTTFNLGNNLSGSINIDVTRGDVQYGTITGNVSLSFSRWAPTGTQASVELILNIGTAASTITFPSSVDATKMTLENYMSTSPTFNVVAPAGVTQLAFLISTVDCGTTLNVTPINRPMRSTQIQTGTPATANVAATGTITASTGSNTVVGSGTLFLTEFVVGRQILNNSNTLIGTVASIANNTNLTLTANAAAGVVSTAYKSRVPVGAQGDRQGTVYTDGTYLYVCAANYDGTTAIWKRIELSAY